jgi:hypothetical protein
VRSRSPWPTGRPAVPSCNSSDDVVAQRDRVSRVTDCRAAESFVDLTALDDDDTDTTFQDTFGGPFVCGIAEGVGPDSAGPRGHFGR